MSDGPINHLLAKDDGCPNQECDGTSADREVRNYDEIWRDGQVHCTKCGTYIRGYDAG